MIFTTSVVISERINEKITHRKFRRGKIFLLEIYEPFKLIYGFQIGNCSFYKVFNISIPIIRVYY